VEKGGRKVEKGNKKGGFKKWLKALWGRDFKGKRWSKRWKKVVSC
jgi:hypothetical protein